MLEAFNQELMRCFDSGELKEYGIPNIEQIAEKLGVSKRYLSDTLKKETGKTSSEHLQRYLIDELKEYGILASNKLQKNWALNILPTSQDYSKRRKA